LIFSHKKEQERDKNNRSEYADSGYDVRAAVKDLAHFSVSSEWESKTFRAVSRQKRAASNIDCVAKGVRVVASRAGAETSPANGVTCVCPFDSTTVAWKQRAEQRHLGWLLNSLRSWRELMF
jgi:hypothetical protein